MTRTFRRLAGVLYAILLPALLQATTTATVNRLYIFGDSYSDTGAGYIDGNGPTAAGYLAQRLDLNLVPPSAPNADENSINFAVSGAGTGSNPGHRIKDALLGLGMHDQVEDFVQRVGTGKIKFQPETTLFFIAGGLNDKRLPTKTTVTNLETEVQMIYKAGGRRFLIALLPTSIPQFSEVGQRLDPAIAGIPSEMKSELPDASVSLSKWGPFFDEVMHNPAKYGITNTTDACAGRAIFNQDTTPCPDPASHFYYHSGHPSTAVHKIVGDMLYQEVLKLPAPE